jgi:hypothetical protein
MGTVHGTGSAELHRLVSRDELARALNGERAAVVRHARTPSASSWPGPGLTP